MPQTIQVTVEIDEIAYRILETSAPEGQPREAIDDALYAEIGSDVYLNRRERLLAAGLLVIHNLYGAYRTPAGDAFLAAHRRTFCPPSVEELTGLVRRAVGLLMTGRRVALYVDRCAGWQLPSEDPVLAFRADAERILGPQE